MNKAREAADRGVQTEKEVFQFRVCPKPSAVDEQEDVGESGDGDERGFFDQSARAVDRGRHQGGCNSMGFLGPKIGPDIGSKMASSSLWF